MIDIEDDLKKIRLSIPLFNIVLNNLKKNMVSYKHIPEDKRDIVFEKMVNIGLLLSDLDKKMKDNINLMFKKSSLKESSLSSDIELIKSILSRCEDLKDIFLGIERDLKKAFLMSHNENLKALYLDFLKIKNEFKTLLRWYERLVELGY